MRNICYLLITIILSTFSFALFPVRSADTIQPEKETVTFTKDVAPIFFKNCAECHRPGEAAPMSLLSYKDARPWAKSIREKVVNREMPPWHADPLHGEFKNDRRLTQLEIDTIAAWVDGGAARGNAADMPPSPTFATGWTAGTEPDVVLEMPVEFDIPAEGELGASGEALFATKPTTLAGCRTLVNFIIDDAGEEDQEGSWYLDGLNLLSDALAQLAGQTPKA